MPELDRPDDLNTCTSKPRVLLDDAMAIRYPIRSINITLEVTSEGASAVNYNQVSQEATVVLRVSYGLNMIKFGLPTRYLLHGTLLCCPISTHFGLCSPGPPLVQPPSPVSLRVYPVRFKESPRFPHRLILFSVFPVPTPFFGRRSTAMGK